MTQEIKAGQKYTRDGRLVAIVTKVDTWYNPVMKEHRTRVFYDGVENGFRYPGSWFEPVDFIKIFPTRVYRRVT